MTLTNKFYEILKKVAKATGYNLVIARITKRNGNYEPILPGATYAPWLSDQSFNETYKIIKNYTLVDKYRCYELWQLVAETVQLHGALIEVGTWKGGSGALIAQRTKLLGMKDNVYLCDTFNGVVKAGVYDSSYKGGEHADENSSGSNKKIEFKQHEIVGRYFPR
jgi:O-methyltransferase